MACRVPSHSSSLRCNASHPRTGQVERHAADERAGPLIAADAVPLTKRGDEGVVREVLGSPSVAADCVDDRHHRRQIAPVQLVKLDA